MKIERIDLLKVIASIIKDLGLIKVIDKRISNDIWEDIFIDVMKFFNYLKYTQNFLSQMLNLSTKVLFRRFQFDVSICASKF